MDIVNWEVEEEQDKTTRREQGQLFHFRLPDGKHPPKQEQI